MMHTLFKSIHAETKPIARDHVEGDWFCFLPRGDKPERSSLRDRSGLLTRGNQTTL